MADDFGVSQTIINLSVALFHLSSSIFPLWWSSFSETLGRRAIFIFAFLLNVPLTFACGMSPNVAFLIAFRLLSGSASSAGQAVGAGTIADIWRPEERAFAMSICYLGPLAGPLFLPLVGGALTQRFGWRSIIWFLTAQGALVLLLIVIALPETKQASQGGSMALPVEVIQDSPVSSSLRKHPLILPFTSVAALRFPAIAIAIFCAALAFGSCYVLNISMQVAFSQPPYSYSPTIVGLLFIPNSVGCIIVSVFGGRWVDRIMVQAAEKAARYDDNGHLKYLPEDRLGPNAWISLALYPATLVAYGWMVQKGMHWVAPSIASFFFGGGVMMVFSATTTMTAEFIPGNSSTGVALNNLIRNIFSCVGTFATQPLLDVMGHGWLFTMVGMVAWLSGYAGVFILKRNSSKWRKKMEKSWGKVAR